MIPARQRHPASEEAAIIRRFAVRLAALLAGLLCVLLLIVAGVLYFRTLATLQQTLRDDLRRRAIAELPQLLADTSSSGPGSPIKESPQEARSRASILVFFVDARMHLLANGGGTPGTQLFDSMAAQVALHTGMPRFTTVGPEDQRLLIYSLPAMRDGHTVGLVQVAISEFTYDQTQDSLLRSLALVSGIGLSAGAAITWLVVSRALHPIREGLRRQRDFVADAAHELRAPLAVLRTAAELGMAPGNAEDQQEAMEQVLLQGSHMARLIDDLALLARVDSGALDIERQDLDLGYWVREVASGMELLAEERSIQLQCSTDPALQVHGDPRRIHQLIMILLDNALKYTPAGGCIVVEATRQGRQARLQVRDSGPGIDAHDLPHLFERFYRADRARGGEGTGLGLAIARWIVEAHGGQIQAGNVPGSGAVFTATLPLAAAPITSGGH
jgi:signal transduction histidine kinase